MPNLTLIQAAEITVEYTETHVNICGQIGDQETKLQLDPLSAIMIGAATLEAGKLLLRKPKDEPHV